MRMRAPQWVTWAESVNRRPSAAAGRPNGCGRPYLRRMRPRVALERLGDVAGEPELAARYVELPQQAAGVPPDGHGVELPVDRVGRAVPPGADADDPRRPARRQERADDARRRGLVGARHGRPADPFAEPLAARHLGP
jgi:hypothetical protein